VISAEKIGDLIKNPSLLEVDKLEEFKEVLNKYPYCSSLHLIYLVGLSSSNHIQFEDQLKVGAAHVMDREQLYNLINDTNSSSETSIVVEEKKEPIEKIELEEEQVSAMAEIDIQSENQIEEETNVIENSQEDFKITDSTLDEDILSHAIEAALEQSIETDNTAEEEKVEKSMEKEEVSIELEVEPEFEEEIIEKIPENLSFIEWLKYKQTRINTIHKKKTEDKKVSLKDINSTMSKKEINKLLDKFISEEPSISKPDKEAYNTSKNVNHSIEESMDITSETLAKIHEMQGNYSKAIASYKQLILLYPEKKAFFASQIEKIKDKIN
jgi:hypothetical protein